MARAVYSNSDVYIFDDPLSALDAHVGRQVNITFVSCMLIEISSLGINHDMLETVPVHSRNCFQVFNKCLKEELNGKTRVLVTNQLHFLPQVDRIILVSEGMVKEEGTFEELSREGTLFQKLMESAGKLENHGGEDEDATNVHNQISERNELQQEFLNDTNSTSTKKKGKSVLIK